MMTHTLALCQSESIHSDEGLMLEMSIFKSFMVAYIFRIVYCFGKVI